MKKVAIVSAALLALAAWRVAVIERRSRGRSSRSGRSLPAPDGGRLTKDTVNVAPGERYDVIWKAREPGKWLLPCHIAHHMTNDNFEQEGGGGLMMILDVRR